MNLVVKRESQWHSLILDAEGNWLATVNTKLVDAEKLKERLEQIVEAK